MMTDDSMTKYNHRMSAQESIESFIHYIEKLQDTPLSDVKKDWLQKKGQEVFDSYYVDIRTDVNLVGEEDRQALLKYFDAVQITLGKMFAHIMLAEFRLYLITNNE